MVIREFIHKWQHLGAYILIVVVGSYGFYAWQSEIQNRTDTQCVAAWEVRDHIRNSIERAAVGSAEALINTVIAGGRSVDDPIFKQYRDEVKVQVDRAKAQLPDPECDLEEAQQRLE